MLDYNTRNGRTYMYFKGEALYPFGHGLSYTTFNYSNFKLNSKAVNSYGEIILSADITNTGKVTGDEVVQLYIQHLHSVVDRPKKELKAFQGITLKPGEKKTVLLKVKAHDLRYWDEGMHKYVLEQDQIKVMAGSSSADVKFQDLINVVK